MEMPSEEN